MTAGSAIFGMLVGLVCMLAIVLPIGAVILRAAVAIANKVLGGGGNIVREDGPGIEADPDPSNPFASPQVQSIVTSGAIPEPSFGLAILIVLIIFLINIAISFAMGFTMGAAFGAPRSAGWIANVISLPINFLIASGIYSAMLPTSFGRASLVTLFQYLIMLMVVVVVGVAVAVIGLALG